MTAGERVDDDGEEGDGVGAGGNGKRGAVPAYSGKIRTAPRSAEEAKAA